MNDSSNTIELGMTFQMTLDSFLEERHPIKSENHLAYEKALLILEDLKKFRNPKTKCRIAQEAMQICSDCIEVYMAYGLYTQDVYERLEIYRQGMELATMNLGKDFFIQSVHDFYDLNEAHSLFHIKFAYACTLFELGYMRKAKVQFEEILRLNPQDHFLVKHYLYTLYLYFEELVACKELLEKYPIKDTFHTYVTFLLYVKSKELQKAKVMIVHLKKKNEYLYDMMTYKRIHMDLKMKQHQPGSEEEASYIYRILSKATHALDYLHIFLTSQK